MEAKMAKNGHDGTKQVTGGEVTKVTPVNKLKALLGAARSVYKDTRLISGAFGEKIAKAVEHEHLHLKAFRSVVAEDRMEPDKLADFYDAQEHYRDVLGLNERATSAQRLPMGETEAEAADEKVTPLRPAAG
jgi:hypothetical protein